LNHPAAVQFGAMTYNSANAAAKSNCVNFVCSLLTSADARKMVHALDFNAKMMNVNDGMTFGTIVPGEWGSYGGWWVLVYDQQALASAQASEAELAALAQPRTAMVPPMAVPAATPTAGANTSAPAQTNVTNVTTYQNYYGNGTETYGTYYYGYGTTYAAASGWTRDEINSARPALPPATTLPAAPDRPPATTLPAAPVLPPAPTYSTDASYRPSVSDMVYPRTYTRTAEPYGNAYRRR
jgi:hypothetical protein